MIKVLVVDDSKVVRMMLKEILSSDPQIKVVAEAEDPYEAREKIKQFSPDVLTLDIEMPRMDGITFLKNLMRLRPMPVVMISSLTQKGADITLEALDIGAIDFIAKKASDDITSIKEYSSEIIDKIKSAAKVDCVKRVAVRSQCQEVKQFSDKVSFKRSKVELVVLGSSTGGVEAIHFVLKNLPENFLPILIAQHIPPLFSASFARRMSRETALSVHEATDRAPLRRGHVYIAPGGLHLELGREARGLQCILRDTDPVNRHKPAVDVLFKSVTEHLGNKAVGVMLTGMGKDGAQGMKALFDAGGHTIAQDEKSSVVWGMPGAAVELGGVTEIVPLLKIPQRLIHLLRD